MRIAAFLFACTLAGSVHAGGIDRLKAFVAGARTAEADFVQTVSDRQGRITQQVSGKMAFSRPGRFRWDYTAPYEQVIVGDGSRLWLYDVDLDQVSVKPLGDVVAGTPAGLTGALLGALAHALFKLLLFGAVGVAEHGLGRPLTLADRGLGCRYPRSAAAFVVGALGMIGVPPMIGFAGRWRIYLSGVELGGAWLGLAMALATVLALFYYVRAVHRVWLGPSQAPAGERCEPKLAGGLLVALIAAVIVLGLIPAWLLAI